MRLLLLENAPVNSQAIAKAVHEAGFSAECVVVETAAQALAALAREPFQLILANLHLVNDVELATLTAQDAPLIILAPPGEETAVAQALHDGATDYLIKDAHNGYLNLLPIALKRAVQRPVPDKPEMADAQAALTALRETELRYQSTLAAITQGVVLQGADGKIQVCNAAAERILGLTTEQMMGLTSVDPRWGAIHEDGSAFPGETHPAMLALRTGQPQFDVTMGVRKPDGSLTWLKVNSWPIWETEGRGVTAVITTFTDITQSRHLIESIRLNEQRYRNIVDNQTELICRYAPDLTLVFVNEAYCRYYNKSREELLGHSFLELIAPEQREAVRRYYAILLENPHVEDYEYAVLLPNGKKRWQAWVDNVIVDESGRPVEIQSVGRDITERKQMEEALRAALEKERELGELKTRFVSMASHEFRTPLAAILASTETLTIYRSRMSETQIDARLEKIRQQVNHLKLLMEEVLQLARIQAERIEFQPEMADLDGLCQELVEEYQSQSIYSGRLFYTCEQSPLMTLFDQRLIRQVISNLISNALKYSANDQSVTVYLRQDENQVKLSVVDKGIGIPEKDIAYLFEPFHRAGNVGVISGTGLGLAIAKRAVNLHGGDILVESEMGQGSTFTLLLPLVG